MTRRTFKAIVSILLQCLLVALIVAPIARATPPIGTGQTIEFDATDNAVSGNTVAMYDVIAVDLDGEGDLDLVTGRPSTTNEVRAWQNDGSPFSGTWSAYGVQVGDTGTAAYAVAAGDLDHDGYVDLVAGGSDDHVYVFKGNSTPFTGPWSTSRDISASSAGDVNDLVVVDIDRDGNLDIVSVHTSSSGSEVSVWENPYDALTNPDVFDEDWTAHTLSQSTSKTANAVAVADIDRDGYVDLVVGYSGTTGAEVVVWENTYDITAWTFTQRNVDAGSGTVNSVGVGDIDRDGLVDIVQGSIGDEVVIWENTYDATAWTFSEHVAASILGDDVEAVALADLDNDGYLDIAVGTGATATNTVMAFGNDADATFDWSFTQHNLGATSTDVMGLTVGDLDNDGDADLATARDNDTSGSGYEIAVWKNDLPHRNAPFDDSGNDVGGNTSMHAVALGDLDGDGDLDIVSGNQESPYFVIAWQNDGTPFSGLWAQNIFGASTDWVSSVALGDLDNDGDLDVVSGSGNLEDYEIVVWENDGTPFSGSWTSNDVGAAVAIVTSVALGDLDNDGDLDIASGSYYEVSGYEVMVWQNDGTPFSGTWTSNDVASPAANTMSVALGDLDNDGYLDIVSGSWLNSGSEISVFQNDGTPFSGFWTPNSAGSSTDNVWSVALGDLNNDGDLDIVSGSWSAEDQEIIAWYNDDSTPFSGYWVQNDIGASTDYVYAVAIGDLDNDGDVDVVSGSEAGEDYEIIAWKNVGGSAGLDVTSTAPTDITDGTEDDVLRIIFTHNGIDGDRTLELNVLNLDVMRSDCLTPYATADANAIIDDVYIRLDDGDGVFSPTLDIAVVTETTLSLTGGVQTINFTNDDASVWVTQTTTLSRTYWISIKTTGDASSQSPNGFCIGLDPDADILVEGKTPDFSVSLQDTDPTNTGGINNNPTAIMLSRFEAISQAGAILVEWETAIEIDNVGFNLYRSMSPGGPYVKLNEALIPSQTPGSVFGAVYTWLDEDVESGITYYYKLEDVEVDSLYTFHGPVSASVQNPTALSLTSFAAQGGGALIVLLVVVLGVGSAFVFQRRRK